jgi:hypothetical protein
VGHADGGWGGEAAEQALCFSCWVRGALQRLALQCPGLGAAADAHTPPATCRLPQVEMLSGHSSFDYAMADFKRYSSMMERCSGDAEACAVLHGFHSVVQWLPMVARASKELRQLRGVAAAQPLLSAAPAGGRVRLGAGALGGLGGWGLLLGPI